MNSSKLNTKKFAEEYQIKKTALYTFLSAVDGLSIFLRIPGVPPILLRNNGVAVEDVVLKCTTFDESVKIVET